MVAQTEILFRSCDEKDHDWVPGFVHRANTNDPNKQVIIWKCWNMSEIDICCGSAKVIVERSGVAVSEEIVAYADSAAYIGYEIQGR